MCVCAVSVGVKGSSVLEWTVLLLQVSSLRIFNKYKLHEFGIVYTSENELVYTNVPPS